MKAYLLVIGLTLMSFVSFAQQSDQWGMYFLNKPLISPSLNGFAGSLEANLHYRKQWTNLPGAPELVYINFDSPLYFLSGAAGFVYSNRKEGAFRFQTIGLSYNQVYETQKFGIFSAGLRLNYQSMGLDGTKLTTPEGKYENNTIDHLDDVIPNGVDRLGAMCYDFGLSWISPYINASISINNNFVKKNITSQAGAFAYKGTPNIQIFAEKQIELLPEIIITPSVLLKAEKAIWQSDLSAKISYKDNIIGLFAFRGYNSISIDALGLGFGYKINDKIWLNYLHEFGLSSLKSVHGGTHEVLLKYNLNKNFGNVIKAPIEYNLRFF